MCDVAAYETPRGSEAVRRFDAVCEAVGIPARIEPTYGASDNNHFALHGIGGLVVACAMHDVHSTGEFTRLDEMDLCVRLVMELMKVDRYFFFQEKVSKRTSYRSEIPQNPGSAHGNDRRILLRK